ncbi:unnamed protein product [Nyctereutes procyonoides]|uniref:(raccoon dog) hypothetical protein n=1 Tax=Nyctereutes procyonoides TaxID=34880 RepID=A0A811ZFM7_NYCPR|nr:unnamed protein product [Nyctereutes procyonoides]
MYEKCSLVIGLALCLIPSLLLVWLLLGLILVIYVCF